MNGAPTSSVGTGTTKRRQRGIRFRSSGCKDSACRRMFPLESNTKMRNLSFLRFDDAASNKPRSCMLLLMVTRKNAALPIFTEPF